MLELLITNATLPDGRTGMSVAVQHGKIVEVAPGLQAPAAETVDARNCLLSPPFCDPHFHMDATLSYGLPRVNESGTLLEGIAVWGELKPSLKVDDLIARALTYCDWAVARGLLAIRSHVDTSDPSLLPVHALLEVMKRVAPYIDLQLVAFPQDGVLRAAGGVDNLKRALDLGVDVVGGIPHFERTMSEGAASVKLLCEIAAQRGTLVDMHCDETDDPISRHIETLAFDAGAAWACERVALHVHAQHGQLLREQAHPAHCRKRRQRRRKPADQHHAAGPARHVSEAPRHDACA
jgi:cytosine/creatinine deaminase